jgi:hypothetical protein
MLRFNKRQKPLKNKGFSHPLPWMQHLLESDDRSDYRGVPTYVCPCGYDMFLIAAVFDGDTQAPGMYLLDGVCCHCGGLVTVPCAADGPDPLEVNDGMSFL